MIQCGHKSGKGAKDPKEKKVERWFLFLQEAEKERMANLAEKLLTALFKVLLGWHLYFCVKKVTIFLPQHYSSKLFFQNTKYDFLFYINFKKSMILLA